jgi:hypothetical protein
MESSDETVAVAVVCICGALHLERCLLALQRQEEAPPFEILVVHGPHLMEVSDLANRFPGVRIVCNEDQENPLELVARAAREAKGDIVLFTEDHCQPRPDWVRQLVDACTPEKAAVGGVVETDANAPPVDRAFYYVDFFRYMRPVKEGVSPTLTVCNVAYRTSHLKAIAPVWREIFQETAVNDALRRRFGPLCLTSAAEVEMRRHVRFRDAVRERYAFARLFGCTRLDYEPKLRRALLRILSPGLPILLLSRMTRKAFRRPGWLPSYLEMLPALTVLVLAWSWGEWLGYMTRKRPPLMPVAPEIRDSSL